MLDDNKYFIKKSFNSYLIPSILSILGGNISIMIDNCIAGIVLGEQALAAMSIVNPIFNMITAFGFLICGGASTLASVSIGSGETEKKNYYFTLSFYLMLFAGFILTMLGLIALEPMVFALGAKGELFTLAKDYCGVLVSASVVLVAIYFPLNFFRIEGKARMGMLLFFIMSILDIILDLLFVVVFGFGMKGLAIATVLSALIAVAAVFPALFSKNLGYRFVKISHPMADIKQIMIKGSPMALGNIYSVVRVRILNAVLLSCGGSLILAAYGCANNVNILGMALVSGVSQTVAPIAGVLYGERDGGGILSVVKNAMKTGCIATAVFWVLVAVFSKPLALLFGMTSPQQLEAAQMAIVVLSANTIFATVSNVLTYYYMTCNQTGLANILTLARGCVFTLLFASIGASLFGAVGVYVGIVLAELASLLLGLLLAAVKKYKNKNYEGILLLNHRLFGAGESLACIAQNFAESISETAMHAEEFCEEHGLTPKEAMTVSLGVEEIMVLMSQYALSQPKECLDFRIFISEFETIVRIRCGGQWFNPLRFEAEDELDNLGVKMLLKMATDLTYSTNLGVNNIKITIAKKGGIEDESNTAHSKALY